MGSARYSISQLFSAAWRFTSDVHGRFILFILLFAVAYSSELIIPWTIGYIINVFVESGFTESAYFRALGGVVAYIGLRLFSTALHHIARYVQLNVAYVARSNLLHKLFTTLLAFPLHWHVRHHSGETIAKLHRASGALETFVSLYIWQITESVVRVGLASIALAALDPWIALTVAVVAGLALAVMIFFNTKVIESIKKRNTIENKINQTAIDYLSNIVTVKTLSFENTASSALQHDLRNGQKFVRTFAKYNELKWGVIDIGYALIMGLALSVFLLTRQRGGHAFDIGQIYVLLNYLERIFQAILGFTSYYSGVIEGYTAFQDGQEILDKESTTATTHMPVTKRWQSADVSKLHFSYYQDGEMLALRNVNLKIGAGERIALVGPSGSGKSTLLKCLAGLNIPNSVNLRVDGSEADFEQLCRTTVMIPQEPEVFSQTMRFNLLMGRQLSEEDLREVIANAVLNPVIEKLPSGLDTDLFQKGLNLSGGEKQRLAIARGMINVNEKQLILFDEPTSSMDVNTERLLIGNILHSFKAQAIIISMHRLHLIDMFDRIIFMSAGDIIESGSFNDLIKARGGFYQTYREYSDGAGP